MIHFHCPQCRRNTYSVWGAPIPPTPDYREWISVLKLSTMWRFEALRNNAIDVLSQDCLDPFEYIELGQRFLVPQWPIMGYRKLVEQSPPSEQDAVRLGLHSFYHLMNLRDESSRAESKSRPHTSNDYDSRISALIADGHLQGVIGADPGSRPLSSCGSTTECPPIMVLEPIFAPRL